jgi:hypothetical protein
LVLQVSVRWDLASLQPPWECSGASRDGTRLREQPEIDIGGHRPRGFKWYGSFERGRLAHIPATSGFTVA